MNYQWYPGHMTKARRMMQEDIKLIDLVIELVDARVPFSSRNPDIDELAKNKSRLILLNKSDLADKAKTAHWVEYFQQKGFYVLELNARTGAGMKAIDGVANDPVDVTRQEQENHDRNGMHLHYASNNPWIKNISIDLLNNQHEDNRFDHHIEIREGIGNHHRNQANRRPNIRNEVGQG